LKGEGKEKKEGVSTVLAIQLPKRGKKGEKANPIPAGVLSSIRKRERGKKRSCFHRFQGRGNQ